MGEHLQLLTKYYDKSTSIVIPIGPILLLYMVLHGSHQYTPNVSIYSSTMDPMGDDHYGIRLVNAKIMLSLLKMRDV